MAGTAVWQKPPRCSCHCPLLSSTADPAVATSALLKGYFAITASRAPAQSPIKDKTLKPVASCLHPLLRLCSGLSLSYDFAERTCQQPGNYSQQNGICHPDSGKQTVNAFTLVLQKTEDRIYLLGLQERHSDTFTRCFLDQEHKG